MQQPLINVESPDCPVCESLGQTYSSSDDHDVVYLENEQVQGEYARTTSDGLELSIIDMTFLDDMTLAGGPDRRSHRLGITCCLEGGMAWKTSGGPEVSLAKGELLVTTHPSTGVCSMSRGQRVRCVDLAVTMDIQLQGNRQAFTDLSLLQQTAMSSRIRAVVADILDGRPGDSVRSMYCQGKARELLALVLDKISSTEEAVRNASLPNEWTQGLLRAKKVIDTDLVNAPSLPQLSRQVCLNEYKLKTGFKKLFGLPVHAYIIHQRLETARQLLQRGDITVTEAAHKVGYTELGRFAGTFRKKYGMTPSEVLKRSAAS